jgi:hypothetical protein
MAKEREDVEVGPLKYRLSCGCVHGVQDCVFEVVDILAVVLTGWCLDGVALTAEVEVW